jgi:hypothetical protein
MERGSSPDVPELELIGVVGQIPTQMEEEECPVTPDTPLVAPGAPVKRDRDEEEEEEEEEEEVPAAKRKLVFE